MVDSKQFFYFGISNQKTPTMPAHAEILKSKSKKNPFRVKYIGENGETIAPSEPLTTRNNCKKNIRAMIKLVICPYTRVSDYFMVVHDFTDKKFTPFRRFKLYSDGLEENFS